MKEITSMKLVKDIVPIFLFQLYMKWLVDPNYTQFTRGFYAKQLKFPYNYTIPAKYCNHAKNFIAHKLNVEEADVICEVTEEKVMGNVD